MTQEQFERRKDRAESEALVISRTDEGFRVYSPAYPSKSYTVSGSPEEPHCTCPDFESHRSDPEWRCKHILAVLEHVGASKGSSQPADNYDEEERKAIQEESKASEKKERKTPKNGLSEMLLKRSISPDGHIDSLSIEFSCQVGKVSSEEVKARAEKALRLQAEIAEAFLNGNGKANGKAKTDNGHAEDGTEPAQMLDIGGMNGKWGRRLFINVKVNGKTSKLFGSRKQLEGFLADAGFPNLRTPIEEGAKLEIPCRVITKPTDDGKYLNIQRVFPIEALRPREPEPR